MGPGSRWLIVIRRDQRPLYRLLHQHFVEDRHVQVILDRREAARRLRDARVLVDRRRSDRRRVLKPKDRDTWQTFGYHLVVQSEGRPADEPSP